MSDNLEAPGMAQYHFHKGLLDTYYCKCPPLMELSAGGQVAAEIQGGGSIHLEGFVNTSQSQRFSHVVGKTERQGIPRISRITRTQRRHSENIQEGQEVGKGGWFQAKGTEM